MATWLYSCIPNTFQSNSLNIFIGWYMFISCARVYCKGSVCPSVDRLHTHKPFSRSGRRMAVVCMLKCMWSTRALCVFVSGGCLVRNGPTRRGAVRIGESLWEGKAQETELRKIWRSWMLMLERRQRRRRMRRRRRRLRRKVLLRLHETRRNGASGNRMGEGWATWYIVRISARPVSYTISSDCSTIIELFC